MKISTIDKNEFLVMFEQSLKNAIGDGNSVIDEGMRYAALEGGKRVRPLCVYYGARAIGKDAEVDEVIRLAVAVELIHNYSLVHDDLQRFSQMLFFGCPFLRRKRSRFHKEIYLRIFDRMQRSPFMGGSQPRPACRSRAG